MQQTQKYQHIKIPKLKQRSIIDNKSNILESIDNLANITPKIDKITSFSLIDVKLNELLHLLNDQHSITAENKEAIEFHIESIRNLSSKPNPMILSQFSTENKENHPVRNSVDSTIEFQCFDGIMHFNDTSRDSFSPFMSPSPQRATLMQTPRTRVIQRTKSPRVSTRLSSRYSVANLNSKTPATVKKVTKYINIILKCSHLYVF